jgi:hypothetical protein
LDSDRYLYQHHWERPPVPTETYSLETRANEAVDDVHAGSYLAVNEIS